MDQPLTISAVGLLLLIGVFVLSLQTRIHRIEKQLEAVLRHFGISEPKAGEPSARVVELARDPQRRIEAIRVYREESGVDLRDAKAVIERIARDQGR